MNMNAKPAALEKRIAELERALTQANAEKTAVEHNRSMLENILNTMGGEAFIKDAEGKYLFANKAFGDDFSVDPQAIIGKDDYYVFPPKTAAMLQENDREIMAGKKAVTIEEGGVLHGKSMTYMTSKVPMMDDSGNVVGILGVGVDITKQKKLEGELKNARKDLEKRVQDRTAQLTETVIQLRKAESRYRTVADFTYDWEYWMQLNGTLKYVSPSCERISGYTPQQFIKNPALFRDIIVPEDQPLWAGHFHDTRSTPGLRELQFRIRRRDGSIRWIEHACQPVNDDQGEVLGFRASNRDITTRKEAEIKLKSAYAEIEGLRKQLQADSTYLQEEIKLDHDYENIIGNSDVIKYVLFRAEQIAPTDTTVLILGETGTGKELIARAIHHASDRNERPLIKVNCAALPVNLIESELFGHEKGAFTDAREKRIGRFELANNATLFLDEIGELPLELQPKLLRVLQDGEFERLGSSKTRQADVRVIAATNRNLEKDVQQKRFRMDLWYRLSVFSISIPPLRDRREDIEQLVTFMVNRFKKKLGKVITSVPNDVLDRLREYAWPGNVRELENVIERAVINTNENALQLDDTLKPGPLEKALENDAPLKSLAEIEREHILLALQQTNWKVHGPDGAAALLDINPSTLRGRMRKQGIQRPSH